MKTKRLRFFSLTCSLAIIVGALLPGGFSQPLPANAGVMRWDTVPTPNSQPNKNDVLNPYISGVPTGSEIRDLSVGNDSKTLIAALTVDKRTINESWDPGPLGAIYASGNRGISWTDSPHRHLMASTGWVSSYHVYNVIVAPDDAKLWAVTVGDSVTGPVQVWVTSDAGASWSNTNVPVLNGVEAISSIDISINYGTGRDFMIATRSGNGAGRYFLMKSAGFSTWKLQPNPSLSLIDFYAAKFSPTYNGDQSFVIVFSDNTSTYYNIGIRDTSSNTTLSWVFSNNGGKGIKIESQSFLTLTSADLSLPSDFSGQSASLRRAFVSLAQTGIYRLDDVQTTTLLPRAGIYSIAFFGTYASGKLIAGFKYGYPCIAAVPTIFMDTPCTCAGSCSIPSLKPPTGAANQGGCPTENMSGIGSAVVAWNPDGSLTYAVTGSGTINNVLLVTTGNAVYFDNTHTILGGTLTSLNDTASAEVWFEYGPTATYGSTTLARTLNLTATFIENIVVALGQSYHFRAVARDPVSGTIVYGQDAIYVHNILSVRTDYGRTRSDGATAFNATLTGLGNDTSADIRFEYGPTVAYGSTTEKTTKAAMGSISYVDPNPVAGTVYHFRASATGSPSNVTVFGADVIYVCGNNIAVTTDSAAYLAPAAATLNGTLDNLGTDVSANVSFEYGTSILYGSATASALVGATGAYNMPAAGLVPGQTYHYRAKAVGNPSGMTVYGADKTYIHGLTVNTDYASYVSSSSAMLNGVLLSLGADPLANVSFDYGLTTAYGSSTAVVPLSSTTAFSALAAGLVPGQVYHYRAKAVGVPSGTTVFGADMVYINGYPWWRGWINKLIPNDESAFSVSRNNGDTWNQLALIDTTIDWFNDVAASADCATMFLASVHRNIGTGCNEFDSVWRYTSSPAVAAPLPALVPAGTYWERVLCRTTSANCFYPQTDLPLLRTISSCTDSKDGGVVGWAAQYGAVISGAATVSGGVMAWSPDYGDYWVSITPRNIVQDFAFESSRVIYTVSPLGLVQRLPYTGTSWSTALPSSSTDMTAHTITARNGKVLVGASFLSNNNGISAAYSSDSARNWFTYKNGTPSGGNVHIIFDVDWEKNFLVYAATDNVSGTVYRNSAPSFTRWEGNDMMDISNGATGPDWSPAPLTLPITAGSYLVPVASPLDSPPHNNTGFYGIVMAFTGDPQPALYAAHDNITYSTMQGWGSAVCRTLEPRTGMPKPGVYWDCLDIFVPPDQKGVSFTLEPSSLKACGCCSINTNTALWAIDNESGLTVDMSVLNSADNILTLMHALQLRGRWNNHTANPAATWDPAYPGYTPSYNQGMLWSYTDCLAKKAPVLRNPPDQALVGADPVTGRNQQIDLSWEQLCLSSVYQLQIAKDRAFTLRVNPQVNNAANIEAVTGSIMVQTDPVNVTSPAIWLSPGALPEAGAFYYWRIRTYQSATRQIAVSPWSEARSFRVKPGFIVNSPYYGVQLLAPDNGCWGCKTRPASFSWSPWKEATKYEFILSKDPEFKQLIIKANTSTTGYEYNGTLDYNADYFWRVRAIEVNGQNIPSDWSATYSFRTEEAGAPEKPAAGDPATPIWVWAIIGLGSILVIVTVILLIRTRS
jgi:hypothetical protein